MQLRNYQINLINKIKQQWAEGKKNVLMQLSTGGGKTVIFCEIISQLKIPTIIIVHRTELLDQIALTLARKKITHSVIGQKQTIRNVVGVQMLELKSSYFSVQSLTRIASIDTLVKLSDDTPWFKDIELVIVDEAHHVLRKNKWGKAVALFPNAKGLFPTATPLRADGCGLGIHAEGICEIIVEGPTMRQLINEGNLSDYRIFAPKTDIDMSKINITSSGEFNLMKLREATHKSKIVGDVVQSYKKFAIGKQGITFAVDIESAIDIAKEFKLANISCEVISSKTPALLRAQIMKKFKDKHLLQLVNVDILGEGIDVPAVEVISFARPTNSYAVYAQQFGRGLRAAPGKSYVIIIDHVGNVLRHNGPPDFLRTWSLNSADKRARNSEISIKIKTCLQCFFIHSRELKKCPHCGYRHIPLTRTSIDHVEGDLIELDLSVLNTLKKEIMRIDAEPRFPSQASTIAKLAILKQHKARKEYQILLREKIAIYAGVLKSKAYDDSSIYRNFYSMFNIDILTAQTLNKKDAEKLINAIDIEISND